MNLLKTLVCAALIASASTVTMSAQRPMIQRGVGILTGESVTSSELPEAAKKFIKIHFGDKKIRKCEHEIFAGTYEIDFTDGTEAEFDDSGLCTEVNAAKGEMLKDSLVKSILPEEAYKTLAAQKLNKNVDEISVSPYAGYKVEFKNSTVDDMQFDTAGVLTHVDYD